MQNKLIPFGELIEEVLNQLKSFQYMESTLNLYRQMYSRVHVFLRAQYNTDVYTHEAGRQFLANLNIGRSTYSAYACAIRRLDDYIDGKPYRSHHGCVCIHVCAGISKQLDAFLLDCSNAGNKPATLQAKERTCALFLNTLECCGCRDLSKLDTIMVSRALLVFSNKDRYAVIRQFLRYIAAHGVTKTDLSGIVPCYRRRKPLPTTYTPDEIYRLEDCIDTETDSGKRNLAMIRLSTRMGLRCGDIARLKLSEIDFETGYINITQQKTGIPLSLQMPTAVAHALSEHLASDRRCTSDGYIFHSMVAPHGPVSTSTIRHAVNECFAASGINTDGKKHGPHAFRASLASSMVNDGVSYDTVRRILGHSNPDMIKHYAKADIENLRLCSIEPPEPGGHFAKLLSGEEVLDCV